MVRFLVHAARPSAPLPFEAEMCISPKFVIAIGVAFGWALAFLSDFLPGSARVAWYALLLWALCGIAWLMLGWRQRVGAFFLILALVVAVLCAHIWLGVPDFLPLLVIPAALAAALISPGAMALTALGETALLLLLSRYPPAGVDLPAAGVASLAIWATAGVVYAIWQPVYQFRTWLWEYSQHEQEALEEARDHRTEREQALADLAHANRQLALANERMAAMRALAEEAQRSKAAFVAKVSHEFRTPLNMIIGLIGVLMETPQVYGRELPVALFEDLNIVRRNCEHLSSMVDDVLDLSQAEAGRLNLRKERVDLAAIVDEALAVVGSLLEKKHLDVQVSMPVDLPLVYCDRTRIRQVILNLVSNAARFTERGGIAIRGRQQGESVVISVSDTGPGIPPEVAERIFEPFAQVTNGIWHDRRGSGLGLSISKQFIELHGGRIWLESQPGAGTTFSFELSISPPLAPSTGPARWIGEDWAWRQRTCRPAIASLPLTPRVVVCDGTGELCPALARCGSDDVEFVDARDLDQAARALAECPAHVFLLNSSSPQNLWPLAEQARAAAADTPIVACYVPSQMARAREAGAADYLVRPVTGPELRRAIQALGQPVRHILVVDDEPDVRQLLARMLSADPGLEVTTASNGAQALEELRADPPDLMLLDIIMPGMDGWQVLKRKGEDPAIRDIPVILVSAQDRLDRPVTSKALLATMGDGFSLSKLLQGSLEFSAMLLKPE